MVTGCSLGKDRRAAATVEFALAATVLFLFVLASIEFARLSIVRHAIDNAAYEACRKVIVPGAQTDDAVAHVHSLLAKYGVRDLRITVSPSPIQEQTPAVTVSIEAPAAASAWGISTFTDGLTLRSSSTLLTERIPIVQVHGLAEPMPAQPAEIPSQPSDADQSAPAPDPAPQPESPSGQPSASDGGPGQPSQPAPTPATPQQQY